MKKLILSLALVVLLSETFCHAMNAGDGYITSRSIASIPTEWVVGFVVTGGFLAILLANKNTSLGGSHAH